MYSDLLYRHSFLFNVTTRETYLAQSKFYRWVLAMPISLRSFANYPCQLPVQSLLHRAAHTLATASSPPILPDQQGGMVTVLLPCPLYSRSTEHMRGAARALAESSLLLLQSLLPFVLCWLATVSKALVHQSSIEHQTCTQQSPCST